VNAELTAMNTISRTMERELDKLDAPARERVVNWFLSWALAQTDRAIVGGEIETPGNGRPLASVPDGDPVQS
jgi:hypothetical protein